MAISLGIYPIFRHTHVFILDGYPIYPKLSALLVDEGPAYIQKRRTAANCEDMDLWTTLSWVRDFAPLGRSLSSSSMFFQCVAKKNASMNPIATSVWLELLTRLYQLHPVTRLYHCCLLGRWLSTSTSTRCASFSSRQVVLSTLTDYCGNMMVMLGVFCCIIIRGTSWMHKCCRWWLLLLLLPWKMSFAGHSLPFTAT